MLKVYHFVYFGLYRLLLKTGDKGIAEYSAAIFLTLIVVSNVFCVIVASELNVQGNISNKAFALLIIAPLGIFNYCHFIYSRRYKVLAEEFNEFEHRRKSLISTISIILVIESIILPVAYKLITT